MNHENDENKKSIDQFNDDKVDGKNVQGGTGHPFGPIHDPNDLGDISPLPGEEPIPDPELMPHERDLLPHEQDGLPPLPGEPNFPAPGPTLPPHP